MGSDVIEAWRFHYHQLNVLFDEIEGFQAFMLTIANHMQRESVYVACEGSERAFLFIYFLRGANSLH